MIKNVATYLLSGKLNKILVFSHEIGYNTFCVKYAAEI